MSSITSPPLSANSSPSLADGRVAEKTRCRVLLADDHTLVRAALRMLLEAEPSVEVIAEAGDGAEALMKIAQLEPEVAVVDVMMPKLSGIEVARRATDAKLCTRVLVVSAFYDGGRVRDALVAGAAGFVPKSAEPAELIAAIHSAAARRCYVPPRLANDLLGTLVGHGNDDTELSAREVEVLRLLALGYGNKEIAEQLSVSVKTVETYKGRALEKIGGKSRVDIIRYAVAHGWLDAAAS